MQRAMARQAEAERERRAKVIAAEGEFQASERLKDAALVIEDHPIAPAAALPADALELGSSQSTTIVFPAPIDLLTPFLERLKGQLLSAELRVDPLSGRLVAVAPGRSSRPGAGAAELEPVDRGAARLVPVLRGPRGADAARAARAAARPRSRTRPAGGCASCRTSTRPSSTRRWSSTRREHVRSIAELDLEQLELVAEAWRLRAEAAREEGKLLFAGINEGRAAGASLQHSHSQLVWLRRGAAGRARRAPAGLPLCELLEVELADGSRVVEQRDGLVLLCPLRRPRAVRVPGRAARARGGRLRAPLLGAALDLGRRGSYAGSPRTGRDR